MNWTKIRGAWKAFMSSLKSKDAVGEIKPQDTSSPEIEEKQIPLADPGDFIVDVEDASLFHSLRNKSISIRIIRHPVNGKDRDRDQLTIVTSLPHKFNAFTLKAMQSYIPQITQVDGNKSHEVIVTKSAACKFSDIQNSILRFMFIRTNREYSWMCEEQIVLIEAFPNPEVLRFHLRVPTCSHLDLGRVMMAIYGVVRKNYGCDYPLCMDHEQNYSFSLEKGRAFTWDELLPEIETAFKNYFKAGVIFSR